MHREIRIYKKESLSPSLPSTALLYIDKSIIYIVYIIYIMSNMYTYTSTYISIPAALLAARNSKEIAENEEDDEGEALPPAPPRRGAAP